MLPLLAAFLAASTSAPLEASMPWWERISVTVDDKGKQQSCSYQSSRLPTGPCDEEMASTLPAIRAKGGPGLYSKLTFERRFSPGARLDSGRLQPGDKLLGQQVMHLTFGADGTIASCKVVGRSGEMIPAYDCDEVKAEVFRASTGASPKAPLQAFMTILVYGHQEQIA
ncbi:MAG TPA: hypothetical protein VM326_02490 [Sphingomicrobium sp.]|nr:hypothetical protein [Sphingomicrobium sp.]